MKVFMVRGGRLGAYEELALEQGLAAIGFESVGDLSSAKTYDDVLAKCQEAFPDSSPRKIGNFAGQLFNFISMKNDDIVAMPRKGTSFVALGTVSGPYQYRSDLGEVRHARKVQWIRTDTPRSDFGQDLLYSLGAFMTVCRISRNNAEERFLAVLNGSPDPTQTRRSPVGASADEASDTETDVEQLALDQIRFHMESRFKGHELSHLVGAILVTEGYVVDVSPPGPDGGVDILARQGSLGFTGTKLCVQVKSSSSPADVTVFRTLQGTMQTYGADHGLLVAWGGVNRAVTRESRLGFFNVRIWDSDDLIEAILRNYDRLPEEWKSELPLKRIWGLVPES